MADARQPEIHRHLRGLFNVGTVAGQSDSELLERFNARHGDSAEMAFAALVERHGPMVLRVCHKVLRNSHDASDAFQATFLVLARKAGSIHCRDTLGPYLHGVALRVARCADATLARRRRHEQRYAEKVATSYVAKPPDDLGRVLHEELGRLPERFRGVAVLCDLEGKTYLEAAGLLGCPPGTVMSRLAEARRRLRGKLTRRGLAPSAGAIGTALAAEAQAAATVLPSALAEATIQAATRFAADPATPGAVVSASVTALTEGVLRAMFLMKLKTLAMLGLVGGVVATGAWVMAQAPQAGSTGSGSTNAAAPADDRLQPLGKTPSPGEGKAGMLGKSNAKSSITKVPLRAQETTTTTTETRVDTSKRPHFAIPPGWVWLVKPSRFRSDNEGWFIQSGGGGYTVADSALDATDGGLRIFFVHVEKNAPTFGFPNLRVVAFDADGGRYPFKQVLGGQGGSDPKGSFSVWHSSFTLDPKVLAPDKVAYLGLETKSTKPR